MSLNRPLPGGVGRLWFGSTITKVGGYKVTLADMLQFAVALFVLIGVTLLAINRIISGADAVTMYGIVLGYAFGVSQGVKANKRENTGAL